MPILPYVSIHSSGEHTVSELRPSKDKLKQYSHENPEFTEEMLDIFLRSKMKNKGVYTSWQRYGPWMASSIDESIKDDSVFVCWGYKKGKEPHQNYYTFNGSEVELFNDMLLIRMDSSMEFKDIVSITSKHVKEWLSKVCVTELSDSELPESELSESKLPKSKLPDSELPESELSESELSEEPNIKLSIKLKPKEGKPTEEKPSKKKGNKSKKMSKKDPFKKFKENSSEEKKQSKNKIMNDLLETIDSEESEEETVEDLLNNIKKPTANKQEDDDDGMYFDEEESDEELGESDSVSKKAKRLQKLKVAAAAAKKANSDDIFDNDNSESEEESDDDDLEEEDDEIEDEQSASIAIADDLECDEELETMFDTKEGLLEFEEYDYGKLDVKWKLPVVHSIWAM